ncbi:MAG: hypothetical protein R6U10_02290 [Thermoplasmatota archaeon]
MVAQRWLAVAAIVAVVASGAVAGLVYYRDVSAIRDVEVTVIDARLPEDYLAEIFRNQSLTVTIHMRLSNPSGRDISGMGTDFDIDIGSTHVGAGGFSGVDVQAHGRVNRTMKVTLSLVDVTAGLLDAVKQKQFFITLDGHVSGDVLYGLARFRQPFTAGYRFP